MNRLGSSPLAVLVAAIVVFVPTAAPDRRPPRIVSALMQDANGNARADRLRLTYSERIRHAADRDGRYPFTVAGYRIRFVGAASGRSLVLVLVEKAQPDQTARPFVRYRRTTSQPVTDRAGNQAAAELFRRTRAHGLAPPAAPATPPAAPTTTPSPSPPSPQDTDGDRTPDAQDCAPKDAAIHPGAADTPDLDFVDSNCDGIDGTEADAIFASPNGNDANPGTKAKPKREIQAALTAAVAGKKRYVLVAFGTYGHVQVATGVGIYGGYDPTSWARRDKFPDGLPLIAGSPEGLLAVGAKDVVLQHLQIRGSNGAGERSAYGIRAINEASLTLQRVAVSAGAGAAGTPGATGETGANGGAGGAGDVGLCDVGDADVPGGPSGPSPMERYLGGKGGDGGQSNFGRPGAPGGIGGGAGNKAPGGPGGEDGNPGKPGGKGARGENGAPGTAGAGGNSSSQLAGTFWLGRKGGAGRTGKPGNGGGGGGGGGGQTGLSVMDGTGNGGGGGGGGGAGGTGGAGGNAGGGSFGLWLINSTVVVEVSSIAAGNGGAGGRGGDGGFGGSGGAGGKGATRCTSEVGAGGDGGFGGSGGRGGGGGGGAGGPSIGIFKAGTSTATVRGDSKISIGTGGPGGAGGRSGPGGDGGAGEPGIVKSISP